MNSYQNQIFRVHENDDYINVNQDMSLTVLLFNLSSYLDKNTVDHIKSICSANSSHSSSIPSRTNDPNNGFDSIDLFYISAQKFINKRPRLPMLFQLFILIFEMKLVSGDINSKCVCL
ncbi:hypothetical protein RF11_13560 [Thelohanellus kitauei]|uniref:Uncharacterized protein n=1 Tax=Thelohanellus kitauei TaxID=669202 RepID=A0A0C2N4X4_THEKT|nr:hypothetical protein RF11_13560 [Thelohanellus kitauei]